MSPALVHALVLLSDTNSALTVPSPGRACSTKRNWSLVPATSPPPPWMVQVVGVCVSVPAGVADPMSVQVYAALQTPGGSVDVVPIVTAESATLLSWLVSCEVTARPSR